MYENYLDFTHDTCMNLFTLCQRDRMRTVLENSPYRKSLLNSPALSNPIMVSNNMGIRSIISPLQQSCTNPLVPQVELRNYGTNTVSSFQIAARLDGMIVESKTINGMLDPLDTLVVGFQSITLPAAACNSSSS